MVSKLIGRHVGWIGTAALGLSLTLCTPGRPTADGTIQGRLTVSLCLGFSLPRSFPWTLLGSECGPRRGPYPNAAIRFVPVDTSPAITVIAASDGSYSARVAPGTYTVEVKFPPLSGRTEVTVGPGETTTAELNSVIQGG